MPASEEAAGGESALPPLPHHTPPSPLAGSGSGAGGSRAPPHLPGSDPGQKGIQSTVSSPRTQLMACGHSQSLSALLHSPGSAGHGSTGSRADGAWS